MSGAGAPRVGRRAGFPNPAGRGRRRGLFPLSETVHRMTAASAERFKLRDRGRIRADLAADLVAFDAATVDDAVSLDRAEASGPRGVAHVFINGTQVVRDGLYLGGARKGRVLRA